MTGKAKRGKWRYIAFMVDGDRSIGRRDLVAELSGRGRGSAFGERFRLTVFERGLGIVRVPHTEKDFAVSLLSSLDSVRGTPVRVTTLRTSGSIKKLKDRYLASDDDLYPSEE